MSFDQNMIIDATTGSIARFVNHSCNPNCRMIKWIVSGQPRMALFAGDRPILTGDELTYDYNFDPFSAKNVQKCLCGWPNCRGVLGPKPREVKPPKTDLKESVKSSVKAGKRKLKEFVGENGDGKGNMAKKRKIKVATGIKRSISSASSKAAKGAAKSATALKKRVSSISVTKVSANSNSKVKAGAKASVKATTKAVTKATAKITAKGAIKAVEKVTKKTTTVKSTPKSSTKATPKKVEPARRASTGSILKKAVVQKTSTGRILKTYSKSPKQAKLLARASTLTIIAGGDENMKPGKIMSVSKTIQSRKSLDKASTPRKAMELSRSAKIRLVEADA
jgi:[histone H3]-lysine4 N-trimethyltransferase ASH1L